MLGNIIKAANSYWSNYLARPSDALNLRFSTPLAFVLQSQERGLTLPV